MILIVLFNLIYGLRILSSSIYPIIFDFIGNFIASGFFKFIFIESLFFIINLTYVYIYT